MSVQRDYTAFAQLNLQREEVRKKNQSFGVFLGVFWEGNETEDALTLIPTLEEVVERLGADAVRHLLEWHLCRR
jgi:hypothetical protein